MSTTDNIRGLLRILRLYEATGDHPMVITPSMMLHNASLYTTGNYTISRRGARQAIDHLEGLLATTPRRRRKLL